MEKRWPGEEYTRHTYSGEKAHGTSPTFSKNKLQGTFLSTCVERNAPNDLAIDPIVKLEICVC